MVVKHLRALVATALLWGCTSAARRPSTARDFAVALLRDDPAVCNVSFGFEIQPEREAIREVHKLLTSRSEELLAIGYLMNGVHPYTLFIFLGRSGHIRVIETTMYWGRVQAKWLGVLQKDDFTRLINDTRAALPCGAPQPLPNLGAALIVYQQGGEVQCSAELFTDQPEGFAQPLRRYLLQEEQVCGPSGEEVSGSH
jgi:hypothetical protein